MLVNRAHTFILQARLAISLAWVAGFVNVVALLTCGTMVSHLTGHGTSLGSQLAEGAWRAALLTAALLLAFFTGAFASGFAIEAGRERRWSSIYVLPATLELVLLGAFSVGVRAHDPTATEVGATLWWMTIAATLAMGVQNATITRISSGVVRTTHLTGIVTDLGHESAQLAIVRWLSGRRGADSRPDARGPSFQRLLLLGTILGAFILGSGCGAMAYLHAPHWCMVAPMALLLFIIVQDLRTPICELEMAVPAGTVARGEGGLAPGVAPGLAPGVAVYRAVPRAGDARESHLPDLAAWIEALPPGAGAVVLDLGRVRAFGPLAANALHAMFVEAARCGRRVVVAGLDGGQVATINALSRSDLLHESNSAPDVGGALRLAMDGGTPDRGVKASVSAS